MRASPKASPVAVSEPNPASAGRVVEAGLKQCRRDVGVADVADEGRCDEIGCGHDAAQRDAQPLEKTKPLQAFSCTFPGRRVFALEIMNQLFQLIEILSAAAEFNLDRRAGRDRRKDALQPR